MEINKNTYVSDILKEHGDLAEVMEIFGVKRVVEGELSDSLNSLARGTNGAILPRANELHALLH